mmetsp:Transcript_7810/g.13099  ORF Transcript_7810/g.13099 Transcript_7810/m.13099 type:complete len:87 (-) Transcript_7810:510-770(-)
MLLPNQELLQNMQYNIECSKCFKLIVPNQEESKNQEGGVRNSRQCKGCSMATCPACFDCRTCSYCGAENQFTDMLEQARSDQIASL